MRLRLFRAARMADAMALVRAELGADALILNTRKVADGFEITAALEPEPPAAFPRLLGVPLLVASHPVSLARALAQRRDGAPVLIDTAGADARDPAQAEELRGLANTADAHMVLVLPSGLDPAEAVELAV